MVGTGEGFLRDGGGSDQRVCSRNAQLRVDVGPTSNHILGPYKNPFRRELRLENTYHTRYALHSS